MLNKSFQSVLCLLLAAIFGAASAWAAPDPLGLEYTNQPALKTINADVAYNQLYSGNGIKIGVVDTGINPNHVEFANNAIAAGYNNGISGTSNFSSFLFDTGYGSDSGHGTFVSSVAAARLDGVARTGNIQGVAYNAQLVIGELGQYSKLTDQRFADTIDYVSAQGVKVINNSWGRDSEWDTPLATAAESYATDRPLTVAALKRAQDRGAVIVFAAGNESVGWPGSPGTLPSIDEEVRKKGGWITVAATTIRGKDPDTDKIEMAQTRPDLSAPKQEDDYYTNYCGDAKLYCISAPGGLIVPKSTTPWGDEGISGALYSTTNEYKHGEGTSYAAPVVSGAVALVAEKYPWMSNKNLATTILTTGTTAGTPSADWGRGLLDVGRAIKGPGIFGDPGNFDENFDANVTSAYSSTFSNDISGVAGLKKLGAGTLTLIGTNTYSGTTTVNAGTLALDFSTATPTTNIIASGSTLALGGGTLLLTGKASTTNSQTVNGLNLNSGDSAITLTANATANPLVLNIGTITRSVGGTVNFNLPTGAQSVSNGITTSTLNGSSGIIGGFATVGHADYAKNTTNLVGGNIEAYTGYTDIDLGGIISNGSTTNARIHDIGTSGNITLGSSTTAVNTLLQNLTTAAATVDIANKTLQTSSIMIGSDKQALTLGAAVNDGFLNAASGGGELILINNSTNALTVNAVVADNGAASSLTKAGAGLLLLNGTNTYSGATTISTGTLNANSSAALGDHSSTNTLIFNGGTLQAGGALSSEASRSVTLTSTGLIDTNGNAVSVAGIMSGAGGLAKSGLGTLTLSGTNTYSGATTISAGTLNANSSAALGDHSYTNNLIFNGGTLQANGAISSEASRSVTLTSTGLIDTNGNAVSVAGIMSGAGGLDKSGLGTLALSGANIFTGPTTISAGTLQVNNGSALGTGAVTNNATLDISSTTLNIGGAYTQSAGAATTLEVAVNGSSSGSIVAKGKATVHDDNSLVLNVSNYVANNNAYKIIQGVTGGGAIAAPVITWRGNNRATFAATTIGDELILTSSRAANGFASDANPGDANARAAGVVLDNVHNPSTDMSYVLNTMDGLSRSQTASALDTLVPQVDAGVLNTDRATLNNFTQLSTDRVEKAHTEVQSKHSARSGVSSGEAGKLDGLWAKGYGSYLNQGTRGGIAGYSAWNAGTALGVDHRFTDALTLGISGGYAYGNVNSDANSANTTINSAQTTLYGGYQDQKRPFFIDTAVSFAYNWYAGWRNINVGNVILRTANGSYDGQQYGAYLGGGYKFKFADAIEVTPLVSLQYNNLHINSYNETGASALNLNAGTQNYNQLQSGLGGRIATTLQSQWGKVTPELHSKWLYDFFGDPFAVTSTFNGGGAAFGANGAKPAVNSFNVGGELKLDLRDEIAVTGKIDAQLRQDFSGVFGSFTVRF